MNPNTGELAALRDDEERDGFERLPAGLDDQARLKIRRADFFRRMAEADRAAVDAMQFAADPEQRPQRREALVNLRGHTPLAQWARRKRREKIAAASRRRNRRKGT